MLTSHSNAALPRQASESDNNTYFKGTLLWGADRILVLLVTTLSVLFIAIGPGAESVVIRSTMARSAPQSSASSRCALLSLSPSGLFRAALLSLICIGWSCGVAMKSPA